MADRALIDANTVTTNIEQPGRSCPAHYRYSASALQQGPAFSADTLYIIGGLYGNLEALRTILEMKRAEQRAGAKVTLLFNGDFNWFDIDASGFCEINETVLMHAALQGNVEAELGGEGVVGCGCNYPAYVEQETVDHSNQIMARLRSRAQSYPHLIRRLAALPMYLTVQVGEERIGVIHGDPESLAGWAFAVENLEPLDEPLRQRLGCRPDDPVTTESSVQRYFSDAGVRAFACTHTCLPFIQDFVFAGRRHLIINNGAAGMPNFEGDTAGLITRVSTACTAPVGSLYGTRVGTARFDALPVRYDQKAWVQRFVENWPAGSGAHRSYFRRITRGPRFRIEQAIRRSAASVPVATPAAGAAE